MLVLHRKNFDGYWLDGKRTRVVIRKITSFYDFARRYYGIDNLLPGSAVKPAAFKSLYPIHVFDVSKQSEGLTEGQL